MKKVSVFVLMFLAMASIGRATPTINYVDSAYNSTATNTSNSLTCGVQATNDLLVGVLVLHQNQIITSTASITTSIGTFNYLTSGTQSGNGNKVFAYTLANPSATGTQNFTFTWVGGSQSTAAIYDISGQNGVNQAYEKAGTDNTAINLFLNSTLANSLILVANTEHTSFSPDAQLTANFSYAYPGGYGGNMSSGSGGAKSVTQTGTGGTGVMIEIAAGATPTPTYTFTQTLTFTNTYTFTNTPTYTPTATPTATYTPVPCNQGVIPDIVPITTPNPYKSPTYYNSFSPPVSSVGQAPASCAPTIANYDKLIEANHTFFLTGENLGAAFLYACGESPSGVFLTCTAIPNGTTELWPQYAPNNAYINQGVTMLWAATATAGAYSLPVLVNAPHLWSVHQQGLTDTVLAPGDWTDLIGSFCFNTANPTTPTVEIYNGTTSYLATVGSYTPFSIYFQIPSGIATGTWSVQFNNGTGGSGEYGWSNASTLKIQSNPFTGGTYNCFTTYGCKGDGVTDDTYAIQATITNAASTKGTAYFPSASNCTGGCIGVYRYTTLIALSSYDNLLGDGPNASILSATAGYSGTYGIGAISGVEHQWIQIKSLGFVMNSVSSSSMSTGSTADSMFALTYFNNTLFQNCSFTCGVNGYDMKAITALKWAGALSCTNTVQNCYFYDGFCMTNFPADTLIYGDNAYIRYAGSFGGSAGPTIPNITADLVDGVNQYNFDNSGLTEGSSCGNLLDMSTGDQHWLVIQNCNVLNQGTPTDSTNYNANQPFLCEGSATTFAQVTITSATSNTITIPNDSGSSFNSGNYKIWIAGGPGTGQYAGILSDVSGLLTLDRILNEAPTSSSFAIVGYADESMGFWNNSASSSTQANVSATADAFELYGAAVDAYVLSCTATTENVGFYLYSTQRTSELGFEGFNYFVDDTSTNSYTIQANGGYGFWHIDQMVSPNTKEGVYAMADEFYDDTVTNPSTAAFVQQISDNGGLTSTNAVNMDGTVIQGFTGSVAGSAVGMSYSGAGLVRNLDFIDGNLLQEAGTYSGATNFWNPVPTPTPGFLNNNSPWVRFQTHAEWQQFLDWK